MCVKGLVSKTGYLVDTMHLPPWVNSPCGNKDSDRAGSIGGWEQDWFCSMYFGSFSNCSWLVSALIG